MPSVFTIGHSTQTSEAFMGLLHLHQVTAVVDVRSNPSSRWAPQFNKNEIKETLHKAGIIYAFLGDELGAHSKDKACQRDGRVQYSLLAATDAFGIGLARVIEGAKRFKLALCCVEKEPFDCHRTILIARHLIAAGVDVQHILSDGTVESHEGTITRLLRQLKISADSLFCPYEEIIADMYKRQEHHIAFRVKTASD